jgi:hypothetical protein
MAATAAARRRGSLWDTVGRRIGWSVAAVVIANAEARRRPAECGARDKLRAARGTRGAVRTQAAQGTGHGSSGNAGGARGSDLASLRVQPQLPATAAAETADEGSAAAAAAAAATAVTEGSDPQLALPPQPLLGRPAGLHSRGIAGWVAPSPLLPPPPPPLLWLRG